MAKNKYKIKKFPALVLFQDEDDFSIFDGDLEDEDEVLEWATSTDVLDNPDEMYRHYWRYYRRKVIVDVRIVLFVTISVISLFQYYGALSKYNEVISHFLTVPKYRLVAATMFKLFSVKTFHSLFDLFSRG